MKSKSFVATILASYAAAATAPWAESGTMVDNDDIVQQAGTFDWNAPFITEENYIRGVNLESDVLIAIEAIRIEIVDLRDILQTIDGTVADNEDQHNNMQGDYNDTVIRHDNNVINV